MERSNYEDESLLFRCPLCFKQILNSQLSIHIQNCDFYSPQVSESHSNSSISSSEEIVEQRDLNFSQSIISMISDRMKLSDYNSELLKTPKTSAFCSESIAACPICFDYFTKTAHVPLLLPNCGHTVCKPCLKTIRNNSFNLCCPICRTPSKSEIKSLPTNFAVLELTEKKPPKLCLKHKMEYIAYCNEEDALICGVCVLDHKSHSCYLFTDKFLTAVTENKKKALKKKAEELMKIKKKWSQNLQILEDNLEEIKMFLEFHTSSINDTEKELIKDIQNGSESCIKDINALAASPGLVEFQNTLRESIGDIDQRVIYLQQKYENFEDLPVSEKLLGSAWKPAKEVQEGSFGVLASGVLEKMTVFLDYKQAILKKKLFCLV
jgi:RING-type zinc-finger/B-box zinc finger